MGKEILSTKQYKTMKRLITITIAFLLFIPFASIHGNNVTFVKNIENILYVGGSGPNNYTSIQDAINDAEDGYIIYVYPKQYNESIVINKSISLIGIIGNGEKPVIDGSMKEKEKVVTIEANNVTFSNFIVMHGRGLVIKNSNDCKIENNEIIKARPLINSTIYAALEIHKSYNCEIRGNFVSKTWGQGVSIWKSSIIMTHNYISYSKSDKGLVIIDSSNCIISYNNMTKNQDGIDADGLRNSIISFNHIYYNDQYGIVVDDSKSVVISNNTIYHHSYGGIMLVDSSFCIIRENEIYNNSWGISVEGTVALPLNKNTGNVVERNNIHDNGYGIYLWEGKENSFIQNNLIDNDYNVGFQQMIETTHPDHPFHNTWYANYYSDWRLPVPKPIKGELDIGFGRFGIIIAIPAFMFDFHPAMEPYKT